MVTPGAPAAPSGRAAGQDRPFDGTEFVVVDVETTGWEPGVARITEVAAVRISGGRVRRVFASLVNPERPIPGPVAELTSITDALVAGAPRIAQVLPEFLGFARGAVLVAHNAPFDVGFLSAACEASGLAWPEFTVLDTVTVARATLGEGEVPDCKLATLARHFGTAVSPSHRALADALATAGVLQALLGRLAAAGVRSVPEVARLARAGAQAGQAGQAGHPWRLRRVRRVRRLWRAGHPQPAGRLRRWAGRLARAAGGCSSRTAG
jgi:DNA polymerase-3 subunit epsilon